MVHCREGHDEGPALTQDDDEGHLDGPDLGLRDDSPGAAPTGALLTAAGTRAAVQQLCEQNKYRSIIYNHAMVVAEDHILLITVWTSAAVPKVCTTTLWLFPRLRGFWKNVRPFIPRLRFCFVFEVEIGSPIIIPLFMLGLVHSGAAS